ncbi:hypothetical protein BYT27DRAFT_7247583 [Phlegmacium glaucopus]|nr:hypothetical protein BYT27DRAFT_7247583 [Phlegmacium glaucopus]
MAPFTNSIASSKATIIYSKWKLPNLKDIIYKKGKNWVFSNIDAKDLKILKVDIDLGGQTRDSLSQLTIEEDDGNQMLEWKWVSELWKEQPTLARLHIFMKLLPTTVDFSARDTILALEPKFNIKQVWSHFMEKHTSPLGLILHKSLSAPTPAPRRLHPPIVATPNPFSALAPSSTTSEVNFEDMKTIESMVSTPKDAKMNLSFTIGDSVNDLLLLFKGERLDTLSTKKRTNCKDAYLQMRWHVFKTCTKYSLLFPSLHFWLNRKDNDGLLQGFLCENLTAVMVESGSRA